MGETFWRAKTNRGKVVYPRKKNTFSICDVARILKSIPLTPPARDDECWPIVMVTLLTLYSTLKESVIRERPYGPDIIRLIESMYERWNPTIPEEGEFAGGGATREF